MRIALRVGTSLMLPYSSLVIIGHAGVVAAISAEENVDVVVFHECNIPKECSVDQRDIRTPSRHPD